MGRSMRVILSVKQALHHLGNTPRHTLPMQFSAGPKAVGYLEKYRPSILARLSKSNGAIDMDLCRSIRERILGWTACRRLTYLPCQGRGLTIIIRIDVIAGSNPAALIFFVRADVRGLSIHPGSRLESALRNGARPVAPLARTDYRTAVHRSSVHSPTRCGP